MGFEAGFAGGAVVFLWMVFSVFAFCSIANAAPYPTRLVVSKDGTGDYSNIQDAINNCKSFPDQRITILVEPGVYEEKIVVNSWNTRISLIGIDADRTVIRWSDAAEGRKNGTFWSYTMLVQANDFRAENLTIENAAGSGPGIGQAVALHVESDRVVIDACRLIADQDTLYAAGENSRQLYRNCYIEGTTDFIFGEGTAVFENCQIHCKTASFITAASTAEGVRFGYVFLDCKLSFAQGVDNVYLGRPWRPFAKTVFVRCDLGNGIHPEGWSRWGYKYAETHYAEFECTGAGADRSERVDWSFELSEDEAKLYTKDHVFNNGLQDPVPLRDWYKD
ncbi:hypothetical protein JIN87_15915 [Pelagicoccus mobilis]|uniref:Pectinesterase n=2 Tax=Pelagicoccus mobilis TaxID=415221 RepID=A0A934S1Y3_9BACT|nr:hypothetical protein [Pelagicoccus mobilis]